MCLIIILRYTINVIFSEMTEMKECKCGRNKCENGFLRHYEYDKRNVPFVLQENVKERIDNFLSDPVLLEPLT